MKDRRGCEIPGCSGWIWCKLVATMLFRGMKVLLKPVAAFFKGRHFDQEMIIRCIRWYVRYKLSYRDLANMMAERGIAVTHTTILRWVQRYIPKFEKRWQPYARPVDASWCIDETYIKLKGHWVYLYRGVDKAGQTIDFFLSEHRDIAAAKQFLQQAIAKRGLPQKLTLDGYAASHEAVGELQTVRTSKYLNHAIEQDHRRVKQRVRPMLGFQRFNHAAITLAGIELIHQSRKSNLIS